MNEAQQREANIEASRKIDNRLPDIRSEYIIRRSGWKDGFNKDNKARKIYDIPMAVIKKYDAYNVVLPKRKYVDGQYYDAIWWMIDRGKYENCC